MLSVIFARHLNLAVLNILDIIMKTDKIDILLNIYAYKIFHISLSIQHHGFLGYFNELSKSQMSRNVDHWTRTCSTTIDLRSSITVSAEKKMVATRINLSFDCEKQATQQYWQNVTWQCTHKVVHATNKFATVLTQLYLQMTVLTRPREWKPRWQPVWANRHCQYANVCRTRRELASFVL